MLAKESLHVIPPHTASWLALSWLCPRTHTVENKHNRENPWSPASISLFFQQAETLSWFLTFPEPLWPWQMLVFKSVGDFATKAMRKHSFLAGSHIFFSRICLHSSPFTHEITHPSWAYAVLYVIELRNPSNLSFIVTSRWPHSSPMLSWVKRAYKCWVESISW
jgi:hypothetical protein